MLISNTAAYAVGNASLISPALADAIATRPQQPPCGNATNAMITVLGGDAHQFFLRVAGGWSPHWTASYYQARQPYDPTEGGPWASRPRWTDTDDFRLNGVVALMADSAIFSHFDMASPSCPRWCRRSTATGATTG